MIKFSLSALLLVGVMLFCSSCFNYSITVGTGSQTGVEVKKSNHYLLFGLAPIGVSDPKAMAGGAENYEITVVHTFIDGLLRGLTFGIYTPTTTIVKK